MTMSSNRSRAEFALTRGCWGLIAVWSLASLWYPFGWDQGILASVGHTIVRGGMPFLDAFELKGPLAYYPFALVEWAFGRTTWGIRLAELVMLFAAAAVIGRAVERLTDKKTGRWAAAFLVLWFASLSFWHTAQPDGWTMMVLALGFVPLLLEPGAVSNGGAFGAGFAVGIVALLKPNYAVFLLVPAVRVFADVGQSRARLAIRLAAIGLGSAIPVATVLAWFVQRGAFDALVEVHINYNASIYAASGSLDLGSRARGVIDYFLSGGLITVLLPAALVGAHELYRRDKRAALTLGSWALLAIAGVALQNKFFEYQWTPIFAPAVILAAVGMHTAFTRALEQPHTHRPTIRLVSALFLVMLLQVSVQPLFDVANWATYMSGLRSAEAYHDTFGVPGPDYRMAEYIRGQAGPDDTLVVIGWSTLR